MRQLLSGIAIAAAVITTTPQAMAQNLFAPVIYINNQAVTQYEVDQRLRFMRILGAPNATPEGAQAELVNDRLKLHAARQFDIKITDEALQAGLAEFAGRGNMSVDEFTAALARGGVEPQAFRDFVTAGVVWREIVRGLIVPQVKISDAEVDRAMQRVIETPVIDRVLLSEIIIPAPKGREQAVMAQAQALAGASEADFAAAARRLSATASAPRGGRLDWVALDNLPPTLRPVIAAMRPGEVTQPLTVPGAVVVFMLRDAQGSLRPGARAQVLDYAVLRLADAQAAAGVAARVDSCDDLQAEGAGATARQTADQTAIPGVIAAQLASLDAGETAVMAAGGAADLVMLCSRQPALLAQAQAQLPVTAEAPDGVAARPGTSDLPDRAMLREQLFNEKINARAEAYLAELRADAVIRKP